MVVATRSCLVVMTVGWRMWVAFSAVRMAWWFVVDFRREERGPLVAVVFVCRLQSPNWSVLISEWNRLLYLQQALPCKDVSLGSGVYRCFTITSEFPFPWSCSIRIWNYQASVDQYNLFLYIINTAEIKQNHLVLCPVLGVLHTNHWMISSEGLSFSAPIVILI